MINPSGHAAVGEVVTSVPEITSTTTPAVGRLTRSVE
jgi:hypothetical protein